MSTTTKQATHTPGPLRIIAAGSLRPDEIGDYAIIDKTHAIIGEAFRQVDEDVLAPARQNATLWAASPDLLSACMNIYYELYDRYDGADKTMQWMGHHLKELSAAIDKADGRALGGLKEQRKDGGM